MVISLQSKLLVILVCLTQTSLSEVKTKVKAPIKRSYALPQIAFLNDPQGLQYYPASSLYTAIPTVFLPNQIGLSATPIANLVLPPSAETKHTQEILETSTPAYGPRVPIQIFKQKHRGHGYVQLEKRPTSYVNSLYGHVRVTPISSVQPHKPKVSIQPSVDLSGQFSQEAASNLYPTTVGPPVVSTYGPPKTIDVASKNRMTGAGPTVYHRLKGGSHRHPIYPMKKMRVYSHVHKDHIHSHYLPPNYPPPSYKFQTTKYAAPPYLPPAPSTPPTQHPQQNSVYAYQSNSQVRFPENQDHLQTLVEEQETQKTNAPNGLTQAIIKNPGVINNYDANIPIHVPSKKPYKFEVNEILKNSELHFVQEAPDTKNNEVNAHSGGLVDYSQHFPYQTPLIFNPQQTFYNPIPVEQQNIIAAPNPLDIYSLPGVNAYQTNHIAPDQDLGTSETVKVPVAIIKGAHNIASQNGYGITMKRQDETKPHGQEELKKTFTPSRRTSDWIPMSGSGVPLATKEETSEDSSETFRREYFSPKKETKIVRQPVGDIISGKIPEEYSPKSGKMPLFRGSERDKRKGSVIDVSHSSTDVSKIGDTSDLVVSSVIKFS